MSASAGLGRNRGGYFGEAIDIADVARRGLAAAERHGWEIDRLASEGGPEVLALRRRSGGGRRRIYVSTGIHGDEPAGPLAVLDRLEADRWPTDADLWVCPCLNPTGFPLNRRESASGHDLNRDYRHLETAEVRSHVAWLQHQPRFDFAVCLHEDWEAKGFYLYELNPDGLASQAEALIDRVSGVCPIDPSPWIDDREARGGIIRPMADLAGRPKWPEAFYLFQQKTRHSYTLEAPSDFELAVRVRALDTALDVLLGLSGDPTRHGPGLC